MEVYSYRTVQSPSQGNFKEKGSKFLSFAYPVRSEAEVKLRVEALKKEYFDARHHCFAWILGAAKERFRAFDDGEPNHSAGDPILGQIKSKNLTNVLIVVVRYFGGVKLGVGGLINAYKSAAGEALDKATIIEEEVIKIYRLMYSYQTTAEVMRLVKEFDLKIKVQNFSAECAMNVMVRFKDEKFFLEKTKILLATNFLLNIEELMEDVH
jgi:uncharacterized YigZ family protein